MPKHSYEARGVNIFLRKGEASTVPRSLDVCYRKLLYSVTVLLDYITQSAFVTTVCRKYYIIIFIIIAKITQNRSKYNTMYVIVCNKIAKISTSAQIKAVEICLRNFADNKVFAHQYRRRTVHSHAHCWHNQVNKTADVDVNSMQSLVYSDTFKL